MGKGRHYIMTSDSVFTCTQRIPHLYCTIYADSAGSPWCIGEYALLFCLWQDLLIILTSTIYNNKHNLSLSSN